MNEHRGVLRRLGPGLITAAVVLGPGSILASSRAGAEQGYALVWMLAVACLFMVTFTAMGARLGCALEVTPLQYLAARFGRPFAAITGISAFLVASGFQFGNNIGVSVAMSGLIPGPAWLWPIFFTGLSIAFLVFAKELYRFLERFMLVLVMAMMTAFVANLFWTGISFPSLAKGLVPSALEGGRLPIAGAMLGTTFSAVAAFYQAYLVRAKGWKREDIKMAIGDARIGIALLGTMGLVIMIGAAQALHGEAANLESIAALASQLSAVLGPLAVVVFSLGLAAASFSSFIANALIGGSLLADGLGKDSALNGRPARTCAIGAMLIGCVVAVGVLGFGKGAVTSLLIAQSATLIAAPLCAILLYALTCSKEVMGDLRNGWPSMILGAAGLAVIGWLNYGLFMRLIS